MVFPVVMLELFGEAVVIVDMVLTEGTLGTGTTGNVETAELGLGVGMEEADEPGNEMVS